MSNLPVLSASAIQDLDKCSWIYYCKKILKLPDKSNAGASRGSTVHTLFECLLNPRHKKHFNTIIKQNGIKKLKVIDRFIKKQIKKYKLEEIDNKDNNNYDLIEEMILVGLKNDFFVKGAKLEKAEKQFDYTNENPAYRIKGYIDKIAIKKTHAEIYDYKSSEKIYEGEDKESNIQAQIYNLWFKKVRKLKSKLKFVFLRHPDNPIQEHEFTDEELDGVEYVLAQTSLYLSDFDIKKAKSNMAAHQPYQKGFRGPIVCGTAKFPGDLKKDGNPKYFCPFKFAFQYFGLWSKDGELLRTAFKKEELSPKNEEIILEMSYSGCPCHQNGF